MKYSVWYHLLYQGIREVDAESLKEAEQKLRSLDIDDLMNKNHVEINVISVFNLEAKRYDT